MAICPVLLVCAPSSGQGKTTMTAALARYHRRQGRRVRVFKCGPDFLDPMVLERASGAAVYSLDLWMVGEDDCKALLAEAAREADIILVEGVMGIHDGQPSSADLAIRFGIPVLLVISAKAMAQTFGAITMGLVTYRPGLRVHGVFANRVGSDHHAAMLRDSLPPGLAWMGHAGSDEGIELGSRHLGLYQAGEIADLDARLDRAADILSGQPITELPELLVFDLPSPASTPGLLEGLHVAIAQDAAFSFIYAANRDLLTKLGARSSVFSPLSDEEVPPQADALYLPGGYPELHAKRLSANERTKASIRTFAAAGKPILAECGGMLYLMETLTDKHGTTFAMVGLLPGQAVMQAKLAALGLQRLDTRIGPLTGHCFHYSTVITPLQPVLTAVHPTREKPGESIFRHGAVTATYMHGYWPSNPSLIAALFHGESI